jgi:hypothetical protein
MKIKKISLILILLIFFCVHTQVVKALTLEEFFSGISNFLKASVFENLLKEFLKILTQASKPQPQSSSFWCHDFNVNLKIGDSGKEVLAIQTALENEGISIGKDKKGYFGVDTALAVKRFQEKYYSEILFPLGFSHGTGFVGKLTRDKLNKLYGCKRPFIESLSQDSGKPGDWITIYGKNLVEAGETFVEFFKDKEYSGAIGKPFITSGDGSYLRFRISGIFAANSGPGTYEIRVKNENGISNLVKFTLLPFPTIYLLSPSAKEEWEAGKTYEIKWDFEDDEGKIAIYLQRWQPDLSGVEEILIADNIPITAEEYHWRIPENQTPSSFYKIKIVKRGEESFNREESEFFSIVRGFPTLEITYPKASAVWKIGDTVRIYWDSTRLKYVRLYIVDPTLVGSGSANYIFEDFIPASKGYLDWKIKKEQLPGANLGFPRKYRIRIDGYNEPFLNAPLILQSFSEEFTIEK